VQRAWELDSRRHCNNHGADDDARRRYWQQYCQLLLLLLLLTLPTDSSFFFLSYSARCVADEATDRYTPTDYTGQWRSQEFARAVRNCAVFSVQCADFLIG